MGPRPPSAWSKRLVDEAPSVFHQQWSSIVLSRVVREVQGAFGDPPACRLRAGGLNEDREQVRADEDGYVQVKITTMPSEAG